MPRRREDANMKRALWLLVMVCITAFVAPVISQQEKTSPHDNVRTPFTTSGAVWKDFDPRQDPLDVTIKRTWEEKGIAYREFTFTGETFEGEPVRVYALFAAPIGAKSFPAVLHIHGGGQTASVR